MQLVTALSLPSCQLSGAAALRLQNEGPGLEFLSRRSSLHTAVEPSTTEISEPGVESTAKRAEIGTAAPEIHGRKIERRGGEHGSSKRIPGEEWVEGGKVLAEEDVLRDKVAHHDRGENMMERDEMYQVMASLESGRVVMYEPMDGKAGRLVRGSCMERQVRSDWQSNG